MRSWSGQLMGIDWKHLPQPLDSLPGGGRHLQVSCLSLCTTGKGRLPQAAHCGPPLTLRLNLEEVLTRAHPSLGWSKTSHPSEGPEDNDGWSSAEDPINSSDAEEEGGVGPRKLVTLAPASLASPALLVGGGVPTAAPLGPGAPGAKEGTLRGQVCPQLVGHHQATSQQEQRAPPRFR